MYCIILCTVLYSEQKSNSSSSNNNRKLNCPDAKRTNFPMNKQFNNLRAPLPLVQRTHLLLQFTRFKVAHLNP